MDLITETRFFVPLWDEAVKQKMMAFWTRRRVVFNGVTDRRLSGRRGSLFGNLTSFDMSKLITAITIDVSPHNEVTCVLKVNTVLQVITEYNRAWWALELQAFESFLLRDDEQDEKWDQFQRRYKKAAWGWALSRGRTGLVMPPDEKP